jgi:hypothetical protein
MKGNRKTNSAQNKSNEKPPEANSNKNKTTATQDQTNSNKNCHKIVIENKEERRGYKEPIVVSTLILAGITLLLFVATGLLYYEAAQSGKSAEAAANSAKEAANVSKETLDEYRKEFEETNRPYVIISNFSIDVKTKGFIHFYFKAINTGKFPATIKFMQTQYGFGADTSKLIELEIPYIRVVNDFIPPDGVFEFNDLVHLDSITPNDIFEGKIAAFLKCDYEYFTDVFKKKYIIHVVFELSYLKNHLGVTRVGISEKEEIIK